MTTRIYARTPTTPDSPATGGADPIATLRAGEWEPGRLAFARGEVSLEQLEGGR